MPDFQGGLVVNSCPENSGSPSILKLDGITGQPYPAYMVASSDCEFGISVAVHTDGTIFVAQPFSATVVGIDPTTGAQKFSVPLTQGNANEVEDPYLAPGEANVNIYGSIIAGDGFAYVAYGYEDAVADSTWVTHLMLLQVDSSGNNNNIDVMDWTTEVPSAILSQVQPIMITNADQGIFLSWEADPLDHDGPLPKPYTSDGRLRPRSARRSSQLVTTGTRQAAPRDSYVETPTFGMAVVTTAGNVSLVNAPALPGQAGPIAPIVQAQDGSFVGSMGMQGTNGNYAQYSMVAFDASGNVRWTVPNEQPQIATADGGVVGQSGITYDSNGNATGQIGAPTYSWLGYAYADGPVEQRLLVAPEVAIGFWPLFRGNQSANKTAASNPQYPPLQTCTTTPGCIGPKQAIYNALGDLIARLSSSALVGGLNETLSQLAQSQVFSRLGTDSKGVPLTTTTFIQYLMKKRPAFYDGLRSQFCNASLTPWSAPCYIPIIGNSETVEGYFQNNPSAGAETGTPSNPLLTFFRPAFILYPSLGENLGNEGAIFHEALHGITGLQDLGILTMLGFGNVFNTASCNITTYIQNRVLQYSQGLDPTNQKCPSAPSPPAN
jgi:hypothetical protein